MHPAGIKYGLANNMLQLYGPAVLFSEQFLEHISAAAREQLHGKRIDGSELLQEVINRGLADIEIVYRGPRKGFRSFYAKLDMVLFETMFPYAERARIGYRTGRTFYFTREFASVLFERKRVLRPTAEADRNYTKMLFLACYDAVRAQCERVIPEDVRHADLLALCMFQAYDQIIMNNFMERFGT